MPKTYGDAIAQARQILQDQDEPYRYPDGDLTAYLNDALNEVYRIRPDFFYPDFEVPEVDDPLLEEDFTPDPRVFTPVVMFMVGMAQLRDDQFTQDSRAVLVMNQFIAKLRTVEA